MPRYLFFLLIVLTLSSFLLRLFRVTEPPDYYFDEVYHAVTAKAYAGNNPAAYDPFSPAPEEGTAYDWLHPPLAKLIQAGSIKILGDGPLGWRLPSVIFGTAIVPATFILAFVLFGPLSAIFAASVIALENLTFVMSRITMNDVFVTFFIIVAFIFAHLYVTGNRIKYLLAASVFLGLAVATKWTGFYAMAALGGYIFLIKARQRVLDLKLILVIIIPLIIYLASYGQFWLQGHSARQFIDLHKQIWWYQNRKDLVHSYGTTPLYCVPEGLAQAKTWCPWILNARGVYFSYEEYGERAGYIYALGNPLIFWLGIVAVSWLVGRYFYLRKGADALIILGYFIFWLPWVLSPRILFLYHYLPSLPFLSIALGLGLAEIYKSKFKIVAIAILLIFVITFFYFYPISSGYPIEPTSIDRYMWLKTWR